MLVVSIIVAAWLLVMAAVVMLCRAAKRGDAALELPEQEVPRPAPERQHEAPAAQAQARSRSAG